MLPEISRSRMYTIQALDKGSAWLKQQSIAAQGTLKHYNADFRTRVVVTGPSNMHILMQSQNAHSQCPSNNNLA